ncbi:MAG: integral rane sensor signal transduction histidine kinase [Actinomycetia bacterium]|nr:integral rane sensor signal transduction histidine kinase [Actinomycetes bacterium]
MPIRLRLTLAALLGALALSSIGGWVFLHQLRNGLHASVDSSLRVRADALVQKVQDSGTNLDFQDAGSTALLAARESIAQVVGPDSRLVDSSQAAGNNVVIPESALAAARRGTTYSEGVVPGDSHAARFLATPVKRREGTYVVIVGTSLASVDDAVSRVRAGILLGDILTVAIATIGAWLLGRFALRPVERMRREVAAISEFDEVTRLDVPRTHDEIALLGNTMDALLGRLHAALAQQRAFVADAGHELRTPLAILRTELELAGRPGRDTDELRRAVANAGEETDRLARLAEALLYLARHDERRHQQRRELQPLQPIFMRATETARGRAGERGIEVALDASPGLVAPVVGDDLRRALDNLLDNAIRHAPRGSRVEVAATLHTNRIVITVRDHGPGFPVEFLAHAFERFRRADASRTHQDDDSGAGLGLAIVRAVARDHGGDAHARNPPDGGGEVAITLPAV